MIPWPNSTWRLRATELIASVSLLLLLTLPVQVQVPAAWAQTSLPDELSKLESTLGVPANGSLIDRLSQLELKVFGQTKSGSMFERLGALQASLNSQKSSLSLPPAPSPPPSPNQPLYQPAEASPEKLEKVRKIIAGAPLSRLSITPNTYPPHFFRIALPAEVDKSDYLPDVLTASKNKIFKFEKWPVPIYITSPPDPLYTASVLAACADWERRTAGRVRFQPVSNQQTARIRVVWSHLGDRSEVKDCTLGAHTVTKWTKKGAGKLTLMSVGAIPVPLYIPSMGPKYTVPPQMIEVNLDMVDNKYKEARYLLLRNIICHELGHALGLLGHSQDKGDLMFNITDEYSRLSDRDLNTLNRLYQKKTDIPL